MTMHDVFCMHGTTVSKIRKQISTGSGAAGKASAIIPHCTAPGGENKQILKYSLPSLEGTANAKHYYIKPTTPSTPSQPQGRLGGERHTSPLLSIRRTRSERAVDHRYNFETFEGTIDPKDVRPSPITRRPPPSLAINHITSINT
jgi:hypothetical protein